MFSNENEEEKYQDFADLLESSFAGVEELKRGDIRQAEILEIHKNEIVVDVGVKHDGIIPQQDIERMDPELYKSLRVGDVVPVYVLNPSDQEGNLIVSLNLGLQGQDWARASELLESGEVVEAEVIGYNRGGLLVRFGRLEGFVPASHVVELKQGLKGPERREEMESFIGRVLALKVVEVNRSRRRLILSEREAQREWHVRQKRRLLETLKVGDIVTGRVTGIRDFGVFVDIGGADGLIHVSELAWHRVPHPSDVVQVGDEVQVYVLELDHEQERIALSLRRTLPDPWDVVEETYHIGQVVEGTVSNVVDFGAFVVLPDGIEGLLHVTEMADGTLTEPYSYLKRGDKVTVQIVRIERERKRIGFSQRGLDLPHPAARPGEGAEAEAAEAQPEDEGEPPAGTGDEGPEEAVSPSPVDNEEVAGGEADASAPATEPPSEEAAETGIEEEPNAPQAS